MLKFDNNNFTEGITTTANSGFAKKRVQWLIEHSTSHQLLCYVDSFELRNPLLRKAANRYMPFLENSAKKDIRIPKIGIFDF
jgi:hypothetical protein